MTTTDPRPKELQEQARQYADQARKRADLRRAEQDGGVSGWIADRAGKWELQGPDELTMQRQKYLWNFLVDYWFRMEMDGWENLPARRPIGAGARPRQSPSAQSLSTGCFTAVGHRPSRAAAVSAACQDPDPANARDRAGTRSGPHRRR